MDYTGTETSVEELMQNQGIMDNTGTETSAEKLTQSYWEADVNASLVTTKEILACQLAVFWVFFLGTT